MIKKGATPNGKCWCDCGGTPNSGSFFLPGHDKRADRYLAAVEGSESIADRLASRGYVPGEGSLREETLHADASYEECGLNAPDGNPCRIIGRGVGMRRHRADTTRHLAE
jgi:hypothetical protein